MWKLEEVYFNQKSRISQKKKMNCIQNPIEIVRTAY